MSSHKKDEWLYANLPTNRSTVHRPLPPLPTNGANSSRKMTPPSASPSAMPDPSRKPLPLLPNESIPATNAIKIQPHNSPRPRRVSFSNTAQDDSKPRCRNPRDRTYPRSCLSAKSSPSKSVSPRSGGGRKETHTHTPTRSSSTHNTNTNKSAAAIEIIQDWISNTSERIALDEGMPPATLSISAFDPVFGDEREDGDFNLGTDEQTAVQDTGAGGNVPQGEPEEGVFSQIMRILALALVRGVPEDPYEVHARKRAERRMKKHLLSLNGHGGHSPAVDGPGEKTTRRKKRHGHEADQVDQSVSALFVACIALCVVAVVVMFTMDFIYLAAVFAD